MRHVRQLSGDEGVTCAGSIREWCKREGVDLQDFIRDGVPGEKLAAIGGHFALSVLEIARKEAGHG